LIAMIAASRNIGFLGKAVFKNCHDCNSLGDTLRLFGFGGWGQNELGGNQDRIIYTINSNFSELNVDRLAGLSFPQRACRNYYQSTNFRAHDNWTYTQQLISALNEEYRETVGLKKLFLDAYEKGKLAQELLFELRNVNLVPPGTSQELLNQRFGPHRYTRSGGSWVIDTSTAGRIGHIGSTFMNIARFFLSEESEIRNKDKLVAVSWGGFDTHSNQTETLTDLITQLAGAIHGLFWTVGAIKPNLLGKLSVYIMTEFGRTVAANGANSTDHGGGNLLLAFFGLRDPVNASRSYDKELGPEFLVAGSQKEQILNLNPRTYGANLDSTHIDLSLFHIYHKISMHAGITVMLKKAYNLTDQQLPEIMDPQFYNMNYLTYENQTRLWNEFLQGLPGWE
ncbi:MAG: DUF1501 domain-containing protein, partial [Deltaproteobacteria bacterium]|nr:DUF1501 domain-containing protein [Deltaproteobacteria bacterium]